MSAGESEPIVTLSEAQAFARIETGAEEAIVAGLIRTASSLCEAFLGQIIIERPFTEAIAASSEWQRLNTAPVRSITGVAQGTAAIGSTAYESDIDATGCGWIRILDPAIVGLVEVSGTAGIATAQNGVPEAIRQGVLRLVAHLFTARDGSAGEIPAAVTALWRPYRRMRLS